MDFAEQPIDLQRNYDRADFIARTLYKLIIDHPDWTAADLMEVCENMWEERCEEQGAPDDFLFSLENERELFDANEAAAINKLLS